MRLCEDQLDAGWYKAFVLADQIEHVEKKKKLHGVSNLVSNSMATSV
jgi:hypothetical protein